MFFFSKEIQLYSFTSHDFPLQCIYEGEGGKQNQGITHLHLSGDRLVAARLSGRIDFLRLETYNQGRQIDWGFMSAYRRSKCINDVSYSLCESF